MDEIKQAEEQISRHQDDCEKLRERVGQMEDEKKEQEKIIEEKKSKIMELE